jgi:glycosyltransferase involved in cell wall biosynthesis
MIVVSNLEYGGAQRQIVELVNNMDPDRYRVRIVSLSDYLPLQKQLRPGIDVDVVYKKSRFDFTVAFKLARLIREYNIELLHSYLFDAEIAARLAGLLSFRRPVVIGSERNTDYTLKRVQLIAYKLTKKLVDAIIANSRAGASFNSSLLGQPESMYRVIHNGVDTNKFKPLDRVKAREPLGLTEDDVVIGVFASFKAQKNHPFLFEAILPMLDSYPRLRLALVGDMLFGGMHGSDDYHAGVIETIETTKLAGHCVLLGNRDDIQDVYPACDFTVLPSLFEGTPNVLLESMACGVPVVATDVSDNAIIVDNDRTGLLVECGDVDGLRSALTVMLDDEEKRKVMGRNAREHMCNTFSSAKLAEKTIAVYDEIANPRLAT